MELSFFTSGDLTLKVPVTPDKETVWLTQDQMSELFNTARSSIAYHISRIFKEGELEKDTSVEFFDRSMGKAFCFAGSPFYRSGKYYRSVHRYFSMDGNSPGN